MTHLYEVQDPELALSAVHEEHEVQRRIVAVHDPQPLRVVGPLIQEGLELGRIEEVAQRRGSRRHECVDLLHESL